MIESHAYSWGKGELLPFLVQKETWFGSEMNGFSRYKTVYILCSEPVSHSLVGSKGRLPGEFLRQGASFDSYGNKSVDNVQWKLKLGNWNFPDIPGATSVADTVINGNTTYVLLSPVVRVPISDTQAITVAEQPVEWLAVRAGAARTDLISVERTQLRVIPAPKGSDNEGKYALLRTSASWVQYGYQGYGANSWNVYESRVNTLCYNTGTGSGVIVNSVNEPYRKGTEAEWQRNHTFSALVTKGMLLEFEPVDEEKISTSATKWWRDLTLVGQELFDLVGSVPSLNVRTIERLQSRALDLLQRRQLGFNDEDRSLVAHNIMRQINLFDGNLIAYASDLSSLGSTIKSTVDLIGDIRNPKKWASAWLSGRFGDRLTIADTNKLLKSFVQQCHNVGHGLLPYRWTVTKSTAESIDNVPCSIKTTLTGTVCLSAGLLGDLENVLAAPYRSDFGLTLGNTWDLIPFSFVVDWIVSIGDVLDSIDMMNETRFIDVKTQYASNSTIATFDLSALSGGEFVGTLEYKAYSRHPAKVTSWLRLKAFSEYLLSSVRPTNIVDGAALLVQSLN